MSIRLLALLRVLSTVPLLLSAFLINGPTFPISVLRSASVACFAIYKVSENKCKDCSI